MESKRFQSECQDLYDRSRYKELRSICERRIKTHRQDKWALYFLGLALLRLEKYADAKAHFTRVRELDPQWGDSVIEYLDEIDAKLSKPKSISPK
ncbi:MAG: tetratricopeptide repeat protein [bacterium]